MEDKLQRDQIDLSKVKGVFVGSGSDGLQCMEVRDAIIKLTQKQAPSLNILYIGTASYDQEQFCTRQTLRFAELDCQIKQLKCVEEIPQNIEQYFNDIDIIIVSGGNSLFAVDRWKMLGINNLITKSIQKGVVIAGGSAGAICWFDGGHSDSMDPCTYKNTFAKETPDQSQKETWKYIRMIGLKNLPGLICPHHDKIQSNGVLRSTDFDQMLLRHSGEQGIGIDHWAALILNGDETYQTLSISEKQGSVLFENENPVISLDQQGVPGVWIKNVVDNQIVTKLCPSQGKVSELLRKADFILDDPLVDQCRKENPQ